MILTVCLNPALQRTLWFAGCRINQVNRAIKKTYTVGGKGVNVARVIHQLGASSCLIYLTGGGTGRDVETLIEEEGIAARSIPVTTSTRVCSTIIDLENNSQTELVEESDAVSSDTVETFFKAYQEHLASASVVVLSGTVPPGFSEDIYGVCIRLARLQGVPVILDAARKLLVCALSEHPFFIKPNCTELAESLNLRPSNIATAFESLQSQGISNTLVTCENQPAWFYHAGVTYRVSFPALDRVNSIGSGDAIAAGVAVGIEQKKSLPEAVRLGMACGCANVLTETAGSIRMEDVNRLLPEIHMELCDGCE